MSECKEHGWAGMNLCRECYPIPKATDHAEELAKALEELMSIVSIHQKATGNNFAWAETDCAQEALTNYREATE